MRRSWIGMIKTQIVKERTLADEGRRKRDTQLNKVYKHIIYLNEYARARKTEKLKGVYKEIIGNV